jgi:hypothetical protein
VSGSPRPPVEVLDSAFLRRYPAEAIAAFLDALNAAPLVLADQDQ